jgi:hypothetical protein
MFHFLNIGSSFGGDVELRSMATINLKTVVDIPLSWQWDYVQRKHFRDIKWKLTSHTHWGDRVTCNGLSAV